MFNHVSYMKILNLKKEDATSIEIVKQSKFSIKYKLLYKYMKKIDSKYRKMLYEKDSNFIKKRQKLTKTQSLLKDNMDFYKLFYSAKYHL